MKQRSIFVFISLLLILSPVFGAMAADTSPRDYAPVQKGFVSSGEKVLPYAPDRIMVKFKRSSIENSSLSIGLQATRPLPGAATGLMSIDVIGKEAGVKKISRAYILMKDRELARRLGSDQWFRIDFEKAVDIPAVVERYASDPNVEVAKPDWRAFPAVVPSDPLYADHWGHNNTAQLPGYDWGGTWDHTGPPVGTAGFDANAQAAWDAAQGFGDSNVIIAILDSGVDIDHPDLNLVSGYDFGVNDSNPDDNSSDAGHGTCCAGVAASAVNNGIGACGAAPGCRIMPCKIANNQGSMYFSAIDNAIYWAADNGADVLSMSLGAYADPGDLPSTDAALEYAWNAGCVILAATSNDNFSYMSYPANHNKVIAVGAASPCGDRKRSSSKTTEVNPGVNTDPNSYTCDGERWWGSNYGSTTKDAAGAVDILAPTILPTTDISGSGGYESGDYDMYFNGTSAATPYAAGCAALVKAANPTFTPAQIRDAMTSTATDIVNVESSSGWDRYSGYGMVNVDAAIGGGGPVAPVADFSGTPTSGDYPLAVAFSDQSTGSPTSWSWTFGDGGNSTLQNPTYTYTAAGTYTVALTTTNTDGSDTATKTNYITVTAPPAPTAAFSGTPTSGSYPLDVAFTDQSTGSPTSWSWSFGDGGTSTLQNPVYTYNAVGSYDVSLTVSNANGNDTTTKLGYVTVTEPGTGFCDDFADGDASDWSPTGGTWSVVGQQLDGFDADNYVINLAPAGNVGAGTMSVDWTSLTGGSYTNGMIIFAYQDAQNYRVADCRDGANKWYIREFVNGSQSNKTYLAETINTNQQYALVVTIDESGLVSLTVDGVSKVSYDFGNVITGQVGVAVQKAHAQFDNFCVDTGGTPPSPPVAAFSGTPTSGTTPLAVTFTDQSTGSPTSWSWDFGDSGTSTAQNPSHTYTAAGTYTVALTATNADGSDTDTKVDYITVTSGGGGTWQVITYDDFEGGWGSYTDGGGDCSLYTGGTYAHQGSNAADIQDNSGVASSFYHTSGHDVSAYVDLEVEFWYMPVSMDRTGEDFWVQYFDGSAWQTVASFDTHVDFENNNFYHEVVSIPAGTYTYPANAKLRFMCDASGNRDDVYIDEVEFRGLTASSSSHPALASNKRSLSSAVSLDGNYPNPFNPMTTILFSLPREMPVTLRIFNVRGQVVTTLVNGTLSAGQHAVDWRANGVSSGVYFYRLETPNFKQTRRMIMLK